jgi:hypothetical protein
VTLIGILSKKLRKVNILIENLCKQVPTKLKSAGAGAETNSFGSATLPSGVNSWANTFPFFTLMTCNIYQSRVFYQQ